MLDKNSCKEKIAMFGINFNYDIDAAYLKLIIGGFRKYNLSQDAFEKTSLCRLD
jgi:hypothetical protein